MENQEGKNDQFIFFFERYHDQSDAEILNILHHHKDYQAAAVNAVVKIAIERGLIHSEQDLMAPEFQNVRNFRFTFFPGIANVYYKKQLKNSVSRVLYLLSLLPVIFGVLSYAKGEYDHALAGIGLGILWAVLCFFYQRSLKSFFLILMFSILAGILVSGTIRLINQSPINVLDLTILIVGTILPAYLLLYLRQLLRINPDDK